MKYFLHDTTAFSDEKVTLLYMNFGFEAVGLFFTILEKIALQEKPVREEVLKTQLYIGKRLQKQLNFMYEIGILSSKNGEVFSETLLNFSEKYQIKKEKTRKRVEEWRAKQPDVTCYTPVTERLRNAPVTPVKISKVKESKVNIKHKYGEYKHVFLTDEQYQKLIDDFGIEKINDVIKKLDEGIETKGYKYKNHNLAIRNQWIKNIGSDNGKSVEQEAGELLNSLRNPNS